MSKNKGLAVDPTKVTDGVRVEHREWNDPTSHPQRGTVIVRLDGTREVAWDGTTAYDTLTAKLARNLTTI